jgi:hypothetical protein
MSLRLKGGGRLTVGVDELSATVGGSLASSSLLVRRVCSGESYVMVALSKALAPRIRVPAVWLRRIRSLEWAGQDEALVVVLSRLALALGDCGDAGAIAAERGELPEVPCDETAVLASPAGCVQVVDNSARKRALLPRID